MMSTRWIILTICAALLTPTAAWGKTDSADHASLLPADTLGYISISSLGDIAEQFRKTATYDFYADPAMQPLIEPARTKAIEAIREGLPAVWRAMGVESPPEDLPWPTGRITMGVRLQITTPEAEDNAYAADPDVDPMIVVIVEMGENMAPLRALVEQGMDRLVDDGATRRREDYRGREIVTITNLGGGSHKAETEAGSNGAHYGGEGSFDDFATYGDEPGFDTSAAAYGDEGEFHVAITVDPELSLVYTYSGTTLLCGLDDSMIKHVLARMDGDPRPSLAKTPDFAATMRRLGDGQIHAYANGAKIVEIIKANLPPGQDRYVRALGLDTLGGIGLSVALAPNEAVQSRVRVLLGASGRKRGVLKILSPNTATTTPPAYVPAGLRGIIVGNYELIDMFDAIGELMVAMGVPPLGMLIQPSMAQTARPGQPPVNFRNDVLGQIGGPLTVMISASEPYSDPNEQMLLFAEVRDAAVLDDAIGRIHLMAGADADLRRQLQGTNLYLMPGFAITGGVTLDESQSSAVAVAGNNFVFGTETGVEQVIRDLGRSDLTSIQADGMYRHAKRFLPAQAGFWGYDNHRIVGAIVWAQLKAAAQEAAEGDADSMDGYGSRSSTNPLSPGGLLLDALKPFVDFSLLPEFSLVEKHFAAGAYHGVSDDNGLFFEGVIVAPPKD